MGRITALLAFACTLAAGTAGAASPPADYPVFFQPWSAAIDAQGASTIGIAAKIALAHPGDPVVVTGSADTVGSSAANRDIAVTRAQVVADALAADGVPRSRIAIISTGALNAPDAPPATYQQFSRRVLIKVGE